MQRAVAERIGDRDGIAGYWLITGRLKQAQDENEAGVSAMLKALTMYASSGNKRGIAMTEENISSVYRALGNHRRALCSQRNRCAYPKRRTTAAA